MPRFEKDGYIIETSDPSESVTLRMSGWAETKARTAATRAADAEDAPSDAAPAQEPQGAPTPTPKAATPKAKADKTTK